MEDTRLATLEWTDRSGTKRTDVIIPQDGGAAKTITLPERGQNVEVYDNEGVYLWGGEVKAVNRRPRVKALFTVRTPKGTVKLFTTSMVLKGCYLRNDTEEEAPKFQGSETITVTFGKTEAEAVLMMLEDAYLEDKYDQGSPLDHGRIRLASAVYSKQLLEIDGGEDEAPSGARKCGSGTATDIQRTRLAYLWGAASVPIDKATWTRTWAVTARKRLPYTSTKLAATGDWEYLSEAEAAVMEEDLRELLR